MNSSRLLYTQEMYSKLSPREEGSEGAVALTGGRGLLTCFLTFLRLWFWLHVVVLEESVHFLLKNHSWSSRMVQQVKDLVLLQRSLGLATAWIQSLAQELRMSWVQQKKKEIFF